MFAASGAGVELPLLVDVTLKGSVVLLTAFALTGVLRRASAGSRHLVWTMTLVGLLVLPMVSFFLPTWQFHVTLAEQAAAPRPRQAKAADECLLLVLEESVRAAPEPEAEVGNQGKPGPLLVAGPVPPAALPEPKAPTEVPGAALPLETWVISVWLAGALLSVVWLLGGWLSLARLVGRCQCARDGSLHDVLADVARTLQIRRPILLLSCQRAIPMTWGLWRPVVLLPQEAQDWTADRLRMVLTHELGHVKRRDCLVQMLAHLARGLYWFHPLAWLAVRQLRMEQEHACDDLVLNGGASAPNYAEQLLAVTTGLPAGFWTAPVALGIGRAARLNRRLVHVLDAERNHRPVRRRTLLGASFAFLGLSLALGSAKLVLAPAGVLADEPKDQVQQQGADKDKALLKRLSEVQQKLAKFYVTPIDEKILADHALKGLLQGLKDPYTDYVSPDDLGRFDSQIKGALIGIGAQLKVVDGRPVVTTPLDGSPALKAGIRPGDLIEEIDGKSTRGVALTEVVQRILGKPGSVVKLKIVHPEGVVEELPITRGEIRFASVHGFSRGPQGQWRFLLDADHKIGYLHVQQFSSRTASEVRESVLALQKDGLKGLILDLRSCPGGLLEQSVEVCKLFLAKGVILTTRGPGKAEKSWTADGKRTLGDFPLLVLVNEHTASAAEIVAGALRDHERAVILGTRTFGKGSVQSILQLDEGGALKVTTAFHFLPSGRNIQKRPGEKTWGVDPSDGFYFPITAAQTDVMRKRGQQRTLLGLKKDELPNIPTRITPKFIEEDQSDLQLGAALRSMVARITGGEFLKVGQENGILIDQANRLEEMRQRREQLLQNVTQLEREIEELRGVVGKDKAPNK
jgi:carboxyl-terminal processing protease